MTKRITLTILVTVLISVLLAGIGTLLLTRYEDRKTTRADLEAKAEALGFIFSEVQLSSPADQTTVRQRLREVQAELRIADAELLVINGRGEVLGEFPAGLSDTQVDVDKLLRDGHLSGVEGSLVWAAAYGERPGFDYAIVLTADGSRLIGPISRWIGLSTLLAVGAGALLAWALGRRLAAPVRAASEASRQIAAGDLTARVPHVGRSNDEVDDLADAINEMAASLERSRGLERQFLLSVSHDLRTPLTSIRGYAEAIADGTAPDPEKAAGVIGSQAQRLERLVTDLLDLAKLDSHQFSLVCRETDLSELVPDVGAAFEHRATHASVELFIDGPDELTLAWADPDRLAQVVGNLLENALKFAESTIALTYRSSAAGAEIVVSDDGPGIAADDLPHVFERLYVTNQTPRRRETGSGLGLAIVKELVEAMGGTVSALPRPTGGTQFVVALGPQEASGRGDRVDGGLDAANDGIDRELVDRSLHVAERNGT